MKINMSRGVQLNIKRIVDILFEFIIRIKVLLPKKEKVSKKSTKIKKIRYNGVLLQIPLHKVLQSVPEERGVGGSF